MTRREGDRSTLDGWTIGILGYGNQGRAQALNLRDSGYDIRVGARPGGSASRAALRDRFPVEEPLVLGDSCDLIALLTPDDTHAAILDGLLTASRARAIVVAHAFSLVYENPPLQESWDLLLVAPSGPGTALRRRGRAGRIPALVGVATDRSGEGLLRARDYAVGAGCSRSALLETTLREEVEIDLFGEQVVLCGGMAALVTAAWETLAERGYDPEAAYLECVRQVGLTADLISRYGVSGMRERISRLALFGDVTRGPRVIGPKVKEAMAEILDEIQDGRFASDWNQEVRGGRVESLKRLDEGRGHPMEGAGERLRNVARENR